jgi:uncharacterized membrane protein YqaE (UPF0057 family)
MLYILALLLRPVAVFIYGKPIQGIINIILCLCFLIPGIIHALFFVHNKYEDKRTDKIVKAIEKAND